MIQRRYETIVGFFVVASLAALLLMVVVIAQQERLWVEKMEYHAVFKNVAGLKEGSEVRLSGVTVGNVKKIIIDPQGRIIVTFDVVGKYKDQVREDSKASIGYMGLLGDKALDITAGSPGTPGIPPDGLVASVEPLDLSDFVARATPTFEDLQKLIKSLSSISAKIDEGKGTLGLFINDPTLYREVTEAATSIRKVTGNLEQGKGLLGTLISDQKLAGQAKRTMDSLDSSISNLKQFSTQMPGLAKQGGSFLDNLREAGKGLPGLVASGQEMADDVDKVAKAAQKSWLLRSKVPKPQERAIRLEGEPGKE